MSETYEYVTDWRNIGISSSWRFRPDVILRTPWGNLIVKRWQGRLFSERKATARCLHFLGLCITWRRLRRFGSYSDLVVDTVQEMGLPSTPLTDFLAKSSPEVSNDPA